MNLELSHLQSLVPINSLSVENQSKLVNKLSIETVSAGKVLFNPGDTDQTSLYVLSGTVEIEQEGRPVVTVKGGSTASAHPIANQKPREAMAIAVSEVGLLRVDDELLDLMLTWDQSAGYIVEEITPDNEHVSDGDWMTSMLQSNIFYRIPPANIHTIFSKFEPVSARAGQHVVTQGEVGDYYYVIKRGAAEVVRTSPGTDREIKLAQLSVGDAFGEEALVTDTKRNATVKMLEDGELMRLSKEDFTELLQAPVMDKVTAKEADMMVVKGAKWVDVRVESEFENDRITGALNIPLYLLRHKTKKLDKDQTYIIYCDTGSRSSAAAFLMSELGFDVYILENGLNGYRHAKAA